MAIWSLPGRAPSMRCTATMRPPSLRMAITTSQLLRAASASAAASIVLASSSVIAGLVRMSSPRFHGLSRSAVTLTSEPDRSSPNPVGGIRRMTYLYVVRCNFTRPDLEASWNAWYGGEKIRQLLGKPMFRAVQRFRLHSGSGRGYAALWQVASPAAFDTAEYRADWGFSEWSPYIADWSRDLFDATATRADLAVAMSGALQVISFDGMDGAGAQAARASLAGAADMWFPAAGLDRHTPLIGLRVASDAAAVSPPPSLPPGLQAGLYRPISEFCAVAQPAH